jgi:hypothetical protein
MAEKKKTGQTVQSIPLDKITVSHNCRRPMPRLQDDGIEPMSFVHEFALSSEQEKRDHFCKMLEDFQKEIVDMARTMADLPDEEIPEDVEAPEFTVEVEEMKVQIQPIIVRSFQSGGSRETKYGIAAGERRFIACAYIQAKLGKKQTVSAIVKSLTVDEAYEIGVQENLQREGIDEVEKGEIYHHWAVEHGQNDTPAPHTEVARHFKRPYHEIRGRINLATQLAPERLALYRQGKINLSDAINEANGQSADRTKPSRKGTRLVPLSIKQICALFDETPRTNVERLKAFAEVMKITYTKALKESDERAEEEQLSEARETEQEETGRRSRRTG